jgi:hypothetical protein
MRRLVKGIEVDRDIEIGVAIITRVVKIDDEVQIFILRSGNVIVKCRYFMTELAQVFRNIRDDTPRLIYFVETPRRRACGTAHLQAMPA